MFRDETQKVKSRAQTAKSSYCLPSVDQVPQPQPQISGERTAATTQVFPFPLSMSTALVSDEPIQFVLCHYVSDDCERNQNHPTASEISRLVAASPAVSAAITSTGLAALSGIRKSAGLMTAAVGEYTKALRLTNTELKDHNDIDIDSRLTAIFWLSMFEVLNSRSPASLEAWNKHMHGAMALFEARGYYQTLDVARIRILTQLRVQIIISCLNSGLTVPSSIMQLSYYAREWRSSANSCADELFDIIASFCRQLANVNDSKWSIDSRDIIAMAVSIDRSLLTWVERLPPRWSYTTWHEGISRDTPHSLGQFAYDRNFHIYPDRWACNVWNFYRSGRILANRLIYNWCTKYQSYSADSALLASPMNPSQVAHVINRLAADIAASVPYAVGSARDNYPTPFSSRSSDHLGALLLLWPLYLAATVGDSKLRDWAICRLESIAGEMGIGQARIMALLLRKH